MFGILILYIIQFMMFFGRNFAGGNKKTCRHGWYTTNNNEPSKPKRSKQASEHKQAEQ